MDKNVKSWILTYKQGEWRMTWRIMMIMITG